MPDPIPLRGTSTHDRLLAQLASLKAPQPFESQNRWRVKARGAARKVAQRAG